jgi:magnesium transporter
LHDTAKIEELCQHFKISSLVIEDILNTLHIAKVEDYGDYMFISIKDLKFDHNKGKVVSTHFSFIFMKHIILCFSENPAFIFTPIITRLNLNSSKLRNKNAEYLLYEMMDIIIDRYIVLCEALSVITNQLEDKVYGNPGQEFLKRIHQNKSNVAAAFHRITPMAEQILKFKKTENDLFPKSSLKYIDDLLDHIRHSVQTIESLRELNISIKDSYFAELSLKMNRVMQILTLVATIFIPLSFFAGVYGMNFENMPELHTRYGYFIFWGVMIVFSVGLVIFFKKKKWF